MEFLRLQVLEQQNIIDDLSKVQTDTASVLSPAYSYSTHTQTAVCFHPALKCRRLAINIMVAINIMQLTFIPKMTRD